jgi:hypothetical protein
MVRVFELATGKKVTRLDNPLVNMDFGVCTFDITGAQQHLKSAVGQASGLF